MDWQRLRLRLRSPSWRMKAATTPTDVLKIACMHAANLINIKLMKCGGLFQAAKMLAIAEAAGLPCILGSMGESSIGSAAGLHFVTARAGIIACELIGPLFITNDPAQGYLVDLATFQAISLRRTRIGSTFEMIDWDNVAEEAAQLLSELSENQIHQSAWQ